MDETKGAMKLFEDVDFISVLTMTPEEQDHALPLLMHLETIGAVTNLQARQATVPVISTLTQLGKKMRDRLKG